MKKNKMSLTTELDLTRAVMQELGRRAGKGGLRILSEKNLEEKATAAMAQLKENTWAKRISTP